MSTASNAEKVAYRLLVGMGLEVIRQYPINTGRHVYFADLYIPALRLIVEIDGGYHCSKDQRRKDSNRSANIRRLGYHVCRLSNGDARNVSKLQAKIKMMQKRIR